MNNGDSGFVFHRPQEKPPDPEDFAEYFAALPNGLDMVCKINVGDPHLNLFLDQIQQLRL